MQEQLSIGQVAQRAGLRPSTLRYYEGIGLIPSPPRSGGRRVYSPDILHRLALIRLAQQAGFSIVEIRAVMQGFAAETPAAERWRAPVEQKLRDVDALAARIDQMKRTLALLQGCECATLDDCGRRCSAQAT